MQKYSLFCHAGVFQDVHIDEQRLLMFAHPTQKQRAFLQQALEMENTVKGVSYTLQPKYKTSEKLTLIILNGLLSIF